MYAQLLLTSLRNCVDLEDFDEEVSAAPVLQILGQCHDWHYIMQLSSPVAEFCKIYMYVYGCKLLDITNSHLHANSKLYCMAVQMLDARSCGFLPPNYISS